MWGHFERIWPTRSKPLSFGIARSVMTRSTWDLSSDLRDFERFQTRRRRDQDILRRLVAACIKSGNEAPGAADAGDNNVHDIPETLLWKSVIARAIADATGDVLPCNRWERRHIQSRAESWILSTREDPGSFLWVCYHLDIDPKPIRIEVDRKAALPKTPLTLPKEHNPEKNGLHNCPHD
jgi:hypothetical protein